MVMLPSGVGQVLVKALETKTSLSVLDVSVRACTVPLKTEKIFWLLLFLIYVVKFLNCRVDAP